MAKRVYAGRTHGSSVSAGTGGDMFDEIIRYLSAEFPADVDRAIYSTAYFIQKQMKAEFKSFSRSQGRPSALQQGRAYDSVTKGGGLSKKGFYGADFGKGKGLGNAFEYRKYKGYATVGWLSSSAAAFGSRWQDGGIKTVSSAESLIYREAAVHAGKKWPYKGHAKTKGFLNTTAADGTPVMYAAPGARINFPGFDFVAPFAQKHNAAIVSTLRRKVEEKVGIAIRGSRDKEIIKEFKIPTGRIYQMQVAVMNRLINKQVSLLLKRAL